MYCLMFSNSGSGGIDVLNDPDTHGDIHAHGDIHDRSCKKLSYTIQAQEDFSFFKPSWISPELGIKRYIKPPSHCRE